MSDSRTHKGGWKDEWLRRVLVQDVTNSNGTGYYESYMKFITPRQEERPFIESYMEQHKERRTEKRHKQNKVLDTAIEVVFLVACVLGGVVVLVAQIAGLLLALVAIIIAAFAVGSVFKEE